MTKDDVHLDAVGGIYMVANTPLFFIRRCRENPVVRALSVKFSSAGILGMLVSVSQGSVLLETSEILLCVILLGIKQDGVALKKARDLGIPARWYADICNILLSQGMSNDKNLVIRVPTIDMPTIAGTQTPRNNIIVTTMPK